MSEKFQPGEEIFDEVEGHMPVMRGVAASAVDDDTEGHVAKAGRLVEDDDTEGHLARSGRLVEDDETEGHAASRKS